LEKLETKRVKKSNRQPRLPRHANVQPVSSDKMRKLMLPLSTIDQVIADYQSWIAKAKTEGEAADLQVYLDYWLLKRKTHERAQSH
jgi:hypothetical protein